MKKKSYERGLWYILLFPLMMTMTFASNSHHTLKLKHAVEIALQKNPNLAQIQKRYEALKEIPSQVQSLPDPVVSIGAVNFPTDTFNRAQEPMTNVQVGFSQYFPFPGKLDLRAQVAEFVATAASYSVEEARLTLTNHISITWWQIYYLDRALETIDNNKMLLRQFIQIAEEKYKTGKGLQQDVLLAQLELSKLTDQEIQVEALRRNQNITLNLLMGKDPSKHIQLAKSSKKRLSSKMNETYLYRLAKEYRPTLKREESNVLAAGSRLDLAKKEYYPDFRPNGKYRVLNYHFSLSLTK